MGCKNGQIRCCLDVFKEYVLLVRNAETEEKADYFACLLVNALWTSITFLEN